MSAIVGGIDDALVLVLLESGISVKLVFLSDQKMPLFYMLDDLLACIRSFFSHSKPVL
jgi:hypothetical protein